ncbi:hypothetical protein [Catenovulum adriaticum]|uniref:Uncharacterized protein n=1 Tax=Catenovulum adriaticum TaxID=2984846 RepID=A0ABY7AIW6_9ALTE|nr:hypothetical protein [Catenovulum sp. TS8]WAJ69538.1 hypothetical protein OLW01_10185 [Catenovulum sp. TS8]
MRIGTEDNPLWVIPENTTRKLLNEHSKYKEEKIDLSRTPSNRSTKNLYIGNILSNPYLTLEEVKIAYYLYELIEEEGLNEKIILTSKKEKTSFRGIGEYGSIYFSNKNKPICGTLQIEKFSFLDYLHKSNLKIQQNELINYLNRLHGFYYITCTEICESNLDYVWSNKKHSAKEILLSDKADIVFVRINEYFTKIDMARSWQ